MRACGKESIIVHKISKNKSTIDKPQTMLGYASKNIKNPFVNKKIKEKATYEKVNARELPIICINNKPSAKISTAANTPDINSQRINPHSRSPFKKAQKIQFFTNSKGWEIMKKRLPDIIKISK